MRRRSQALVQLLILLLLVGCANFLAEGRREKEIRHGEILIARSYLEQGMPDKAAKSLTKLMKESGDDPNIMNLLGLAYLAGGKKERALRVFQKSYLVEPRPSTALNLSAVLIEMKNFADALLVLHKVENTENYEHKERIYLNLGICYESLKQREKALLFYKKALKQNSNHYEAAMKVANYFKLKKLEPKAFPYYNKAKNICPTCLDPVEEMSMIYINQEKSKKALLLLKKYLKNKKIKNYEKKRAYQLISMFKKGS